jgi:hypothetical protein
MRRFRLFSFHLFSLSRRAASRRQPVTGAARGRGLQASGFGKREESQATSCKARKSPFIPLFQRGKEGDLNIGSMDRPRCGSDNNAVREVKEVEEVRAKKGFGIKADSKRLFRSFRLFRLFR